MTADAAFIVDLFAGVGDVSVKRMFGGAGVYADGVMFALVDGGDGIFLKVDEALKTELRDLGCRPFVWTPSEGPRAGVPVEMSYWELPSSALDDPDEAAAWGRKALAVAVAAKAAKKPKAKPRKPKR